MKTSKITLLPYTYDQLCFDVITFFSSHFKLRSTNKIMQCNGFVHRIDTKIILLYYIEKYIAHAQI